MIYGGTRGYVFAIDPTTGEELWRSRLHTGGFMGGMSGDVMVMLRERIIIATCDGRIWGLNAANGEILWYNGLKGLGHSVVTMATEGVSIQYVHKHTHSSSNS